MLVLSGFQLADDRHLPGFVCQDLVGLSPVWHWHESFATKIAKTQEILNDHDGTRGVREGHGNLQLPR
jgi:hypothetical protein